MLHLDFMLGILNTEIGVFDWWNIFDIQNRQWNLKTILV